MLVSVVCGNIEAASNCECHIFLKLLITWYKGNIGKLNNYAIFA